MQKIPTALELFRLAQAMRSAAATLATRDINDQMRVAAIQLEGYAAAWPIPREAARHYAAGLSLLSRAE